MNALAWYALGVVTPVLAYGALWVLAPVWDFLTDHVSIRLSDDLTKRPDWHGRWMQLGQVAREHGFAVLLKAPRSTRGITVLVSWGRRWSRREVWDFAHERGWPGFERPWRGWRP